MKTYFVITDVHSFYTEMIEALTKNGFDINNDEHIIISCGDNFDRGDESLEVLNFLYSMLQKDRIILVRGNHEDLFPDLVRREMFESYDIHNGTLKTLLALNNPPLESFWEMTPNSYKNYDKRIDELISKSVDYYETEHYIFVHGFIPVKANKMSGALAYDKDWRNGRWADARWYNGMEHARNGLNQTGKTIVCGHWHCSYGNVRQMLEGRPYHVLNRAEFDTIHYTPEELFKPYINEKEGIIGLDACTAFSGFSNCLVIEEDKL